jgi:hypothetical protein
MHVCNIKLRPVLSHLGIVALDSKTARPTRYTAQHQDEWRLCMLRPRGFRSNPWHANRFLAVFSGYCECIFVNRCAWFVETVSFCRFESVSRINLTVQSVSRVVHYYVPPLLESTWSLSMFACYRVHNMLYAVVEYTLHFDKPLASHSTATLVGLFAQSIKRSPVLLIRCALFD